MAMMTRAVGTRIDQDRGRRWAPPSIVGVTKKLLASMVGVTVGALVVVFGFAAQASAQPPGGTERFTIIETSPSGGPVVASGAFSASGTDFESASNTDTAGQSTFRFPNGTIVANHSDTGPGSFSFNPVACVGHFSGSGTYTVTNGTGAYAGISGNGTYTYRGTVIATRTPTGCGDTIGGVTVVHAVGPVSFGGGS